MRRREFIAGFAGAAAVVRSQTPARPQHVVVYRESGRYGGWPANHGMWAWGNEFLVGFESGWFKYDQNRHSIDRSRPAEDLLARSKDGGATWSIEKPASLLPPPKTVVAGIPASSGERAITQLGTPINFTQPGFALTARMAASDTGPSWFFYTSDRGKNWSGPFAIPDFGQPGIAARTDYLIDDRDTLTMFLTAAKQDRKEGRVICVRTQDGGRTWKMLSYLGPEPPEREYAIMPSSVRLSAKGILTAVRHNHYIDLWRSDDNGGTWTSLGKVVEDTGRGNPPSMTKLRDGRIALTWGYRAEPYSIKAKVSRDDGRTWSNELVLRDDGGAWDIGYTRTLQRPDGKLVTAYYYTLDDHAERFIGATIWDAGAART